MRRQKSYGETVRSVAGFALIGPGLFLLFGMWWARLDD
jgi:hypothetical protein